MKNASTIWGEIFFLYYNKEKNLLHPTSSGFESRATHTEKAIFLYLQIVLVDLFIVIIYCYIDPFVKIG